MIKNCWSSQQFKNGARANIKQRTSGLTPGLFPTVRGPSGSVSSTNRSTDTQTPQPGSLWESSPVTTDTKGGVCPPHERTRVDTRRFKVHAKTRSQKESNLLANLCDTVAFRWFRAVNDSRVAAPSQGGGRRAREWRIWRTSSGATPTAMLSVKVGSTGLWGRVAQRAFCGRSPTAVRFLVC